MNLGGAVRLRPSGAIFMICCLVVIYLLYSWSVGKSKLPANSNLSASDNSKTDLRQLLCAAIQSAEAGGREVKLVREKSNAEINERSKGKTKEGVKDPYTDGDMKSHHVMYGTLKNVFSRLKVISEEHGSAGEDLPPPPSPELSCAALEAISTSDEQLEATDDITVWIDPLDATKEYTENLVKYVTTMVCVAVRGKPVIGVIHKPFESKTYWGWKNVGLSEDLQKMRGKERANINQFVISMSHAGPVKEFIKKGFPEAAIEEAAGAGYKSLLVANSEAAAYVHKTRIKKWDVCAGHAILSALGGKVTTLKGSEISYDNEADELIEDGLLATLRDQELYLKKLNQSN